MDHIEKYEHLINLLTEAQEIGGKKYLLKEELEKLFVKGNKRSGTRIRKIMQLVKAAAQEIRDDVQEYRKK